MKKLIFTFLLVSLTGLMLQAQIPLKLPSQTVRSAKNMFTGLTNISTRTVSAQVLLDYANPDYAQYGTFAYAIFPLNSRYDTAEANHDTTTFPELNYGGVGFDSLYDNYSTLSYNKHDVDSINIDTIFFGLSHVNHSGTNDTLIIKIIPLVATADISGYPNTSATPFASDTIVTDSSLSDSIDRSVTYLWTPGIAIPAGQFGVMEYYYGPTIDTFYLWTGYPYFGSSGCVFPDKTQLAYESTFYPNSYAYWVENSYGLLPTTTGGDIYYPCVAADKTYTSGVDGADFIQDIDIDASVRLHFLSGINNISTNFNLKSISPNPASQSAMVNLGLKNNSNVTINLVDLSGRILQSINEGNQTIGAHQFPIDLSNITSGAYIVNIVGDNGDKTFGKLVVIN